MSSRTLSRVRSRRSAISAIVTMSSGSIPANLEWTNGLDLVDRTQRSVGEGRRRPHELAIAEPVHDAKGRVITSDLKKLPCDVLASRSPSITSVNSYSVIADLLPLACIDSSADLPRMVARHSGRRPDPNETVMLLALNVARPTDDPGEVFNQPPVGLGEIERLLDLLLGVARPVGHVLTDTTARCQMSTGCESERQRRLRG